MAHRRPSSIPSGRWADLWTDCLDELGEPSRVQARILERMVLNLIAADIALEAAQAEPSVKGSKGQPVEHPMFQVAARCDTQARNNAKELRLLKPNTKRAKKPSDPFTHLDGDDLAKLRARKAV